MAYVVTENCILCKYGSCVEVCPVICFHEGENFLVINSDECIDCGMCVEACEADAIYRDIDLPDEYKNYIELNNKYSKIWPMITKITSRPENPDYWNGHENKLQFLKD